MEIEIASCTESRTDPDLRAATETEITTGTDERKTRSAHPQRRAISRRAILPPVYDPAVYASRLSLVRRPGPALRRPPTADVVSCSRAAKKAWPSAHGHDQTAGTMLAGL